MRRFFLPRPRRAASVWAFTSLALGACGGANESRVAALEQQVATLRQQAESSASTEQLAQMLDVLQREVARISQAIEARDEAPQPTPKAAPPANRKPWWADAQAILEAGEGVTVAGDKYTVKRAWLLERLRELSQKPPKLAAIKGGVVVRAIRPNSFLTRMGLANNDVIRSVAGKEVASPQEIWAAVRANEGPLVVGLERKRKEMTLTYVVQSE